MPRPFSSSAPLFDCSARIPSIRRQWPPDGVAAPSHCRCLSASNRRIAHRSRSLLHPAGPRAGSMSAVGQSRSVCRRGATADVRFAPDSDRKSDAKASVAKGHNRTHAPRQSGRGACGVSFSNAVPCTYRQLAQFVPNCRKTRMCCRCWQLAVLPAGARRIARRLCDLQLE